MDNAHLARSLEEVAPAPSVVTIGFFDGVHRGHQAIIARAVRSARERDLRAVSVTFDRHPMEVIRPGSQPHYLQTLERRVAALLDQDVDLVVVLPFTLEFSQKTPEAFATEVLAEALQAVHVIVGANFRFGHKASGDVDALRLLGDDLGFSVDAVDLLAADEEAISSTQIREAVERGDVAGAAAALGRPFTLEGPVVRGDGRGSQIGIPTANVEIDDRMQLPATGVYAARAEVPGSGRRWPCVVNVGRRPTFGGDTVTVEAHLLDVDVDLYGEHLALQFVTRIRPEQRFEGPDELVAQIRRDIEAARAALTEG